MVRRALGALPRGGHVIEVKETPMPTGNDVRRMFLDFFVQKGHRQVHSSSLVPANDPTLLFTNAGMNQFKDCLLYTSFTGTAAEITPIRSVDKLPVGDGSVGPVTKKIRAELFGLFDGSKPDKHKWLTPVPVK